MRTKLGLPSIGLVHITLINYWHKLKKVPISHLSSFCFILFQQDLVWITNYNKNPSLLKVAWCYSEHHSDWPQLSSLGICTWCHFWQTSYFTFQIFFLVYLINLLIKKINNRAHYLRLPSINFVQPFIPKLWNPPCSQDRSASLYLQSLRTGRSLVLFAFLSIIYSLRPKKKRLHLGQFRLKLHNRKKEFLLANVVLF